MMTLSLLFLGFVLGVVAFGLVLITRPNVMFWFTTISYYMNTE